MKIRWIKCMKEYIIVTDRRNYGIDIMKIIAAFMVVFYHFGHREYDFIMPSRYLPNIDYIFQTLVACSIPLFFMVNSALLLNKKYTNFNILKKIFKVLFIILIWKVIDFPDWFLKTLIILYILYPLFKKLFDRDSKWLYIIICFFIAFPDIYNMIVSIFKVCELKNISVFPYQLSIAELPRTVFFTLYSIPLFLLGGIVVKKQWNIEKWKIIFLIILGWGECLFEAITNTRYSRELFDSGNGNFPTIGALMMALGFFLLFYNLEVPERYKNVICILGQNVLPVYLFHMIFIRWINSIIIPPIHTLPFVVDIFISALIYLLTVGIGQILMKIPYLKELVKI